MTLDFGTNKAGGDWGVIDDGVMGGLSKGNLDFADNKLIFSGKVSLENNGGFSSLKSPFQKTDLSAYKELVMRVKGEGQKFAFTMETSRTWYYPNFKKELELEGGDWQTLRIPLAEFEKTQVGRPMGEQMQKSDLAQVLRIGFITNSKKASSFKLEVDYLAFE